MAFENRANFWTTKGRGLVFCLAASSIACLLFDFYKLCPMRTFTLFIFLPAFVALLVFATADFFLGNRQLGRAIVLGLAAGIIAAIAYDVFRLPFVFAKELGIANVVPPLQLFKVFPRFGAMILGEPVEQSSYSLAAQCLGWIYHFGNGATFGVMYLALLGDASRRNWMWGVLMAVGIELAMLLTPYPAYFSIPLTLAFVVVTLTAHLIFGVAMGITVQRVSKAAVA
jgi:hypothetical protein